MFGCALKPVSIEDKAYAVNRTFNAARRKSVRKSFLAQTNPPDTFVSLPSRDLYERWKTEVTLI